MNEAFLKELGLDEGIIQAILERLRNHDAAQAETYNGMLRTTREGRIRDLMEHAGVREGMAFRAVMTELISVLEQGGDVAAHLDQMKEHEPGLFAPPAPYFATSLREEGGISDDNAPFHWIRSREKGGR